MLKYASFCKITHKYCFPMGSLCIALKSPIYHMGADKILSFKGVMGTLFGGIHVAMVSYKTE